MTDAERVGTIPAKFREKTSENHRQEVWPSTWLVIREIVTAEFAAVREEER